jgi:hypothetical protein
MGTQINIEANRPCDGLDITIELAPKCVPVSTETASGIILDANADFGETVGGRPLTGASGSCIDIASGVVTGIILKGSAHFLDSNIGDLQVEIVVELK